MQYLQDCRYDVFVKRNDIWTMKDFPWLHKIDLIRHNINELYRCFMSLPDWRVITFTASLDFEQVNALEWDLHCIYVWLNRMMSIFWHSGEFYAGEGGFA